MTDGTRYLAARRLDTAGNDIVSAVFHEAEQAELAFDATVDRGYEPGEVDVLMSSAAADEYFPGETVIVEHDRKTAEGAGVGGAVGTAVGAMTGAFAALGTVVAISPLGLVIAGPLAATLAGAGAGGVAGGLVGALVGAGISEERATVYKTAIEEGGIVLAVRPMNGTEADELIDLWEDLGAEATYGG